MQQQQQCYELVDSPAAELSLEAAALLICFYPNHKAANKSYSARRPRVKAMNTTTAWLNVRHNQGTAGHGYT
jgi:hypothetical protein